MAAIYKNPFDPSHEIRLLRLHAQPSSSEPSSTPISCDLYPIAFEKAKEQGYEALSYSWGSPDVLLPIWVSGIEVLVRENLRVALQHFREDSSDVVLWIDALCIDQSNDEEKSKQVLMMKDIYACAKNTRVWLGPADKTSEATLLKMADIGRIITDRGAFELFIKMTVLAIEDTEGAVLAEQQVGALVEDMIDHDVDHIDDSIRRLRGVCDLLLRPYWRRVWILQEVVVSKHVEVYSGKLKVGFALVHAAILYNIFMHIHLSQKIGKSLVALLEALDDGEFPPDCELKGQFDAVVAIVLPQAALSVSGMRFRYHESTQEDRDGRSNLIHLLSRILVGREATDPRDKIWALLGMATDAAELQIIPNYAATKMCTSVYIDATRALIAAGHIDIIAFSQPSKKEPNVPSWVPDWREDVKLPYGQLPWATPYKVSDSLPTPSLERLSQDVPSSHLTLKGFPIDTIETLKPQLNNGNPLSQAQRLQACTYLQDIMMLCQISNEKLAQTGVDPYPDPTARASAHERVPVADLYSTGFVRRATLDDCQTGHAEVVRDFIQRQKDGPGAGVPITNTFNSYYNMMSEQVHRRPFVSVKGFVGLVPKEAGEGDVLVIFLGARFPYVVRRKDGECVLIGEAFVHGVTYGEFGGEGLEVEEFVLR